MARGSLSGLKILVTRPRDQAVHLAQAIERAGGVPLLLPLLQIGPADEEALHERVLRLNDFDLVIFISPNAVRYGMEAIRNTLGDMPSGVRVAAIGLTSAKDLKDWGVENVLVPEVRHDSEGLLEKLQRVKGLRVMIFRGDGGRELLGDELKARGAEIEYVACYRRSKAPLEGLDALHPDALTVTSSESLDYLWEIAPFRGVPLFVPHARIAELAKSRGWPNVHLTGHGDDGLLDGLLEWANRRAKTE